MKNTKKLVRAAVLTALACVLTIIPKIPVGVGYVHFGDTVIYIAAIFLGPIYGAAVGAIGHTMADFFSGFAVFCLPTFIIKALMGFIVGKIVYSHNDMKHFMLGASAALLIVTAGYFIAEIPFFGYEAALVSLISSPLQWLMSMLSSALVIPLLMKSKIY